MRIFLSVLVSMGIAFGMYVIAIHSMGKAVGGSPQTAIANTTVQMQLVNLAQAERMHFVQSSSYATLEQLASNDEFKLPHPDPDNYVYSLEVGDGTFKVTARHDSANGKPDSFPVFTIDQTMHVERVDSQGDAASDTSANATTDAANPSDAKSDDAKAPNAQPVAQAGTQPEAQGAKPDEIPSFPQALPELPAGLAAAAGKNSGAPQDSAQPSR